MQVGEAIEDDEDAAAAAFDAFARREQQPLVAFAWSLTGSYAVAEEVVQEALASAWQSWDRVAGFDKPGAWARRVVISRCTDRRRRAGREERALARLGGRRQQDVAEPSQPDRELWAAVRDLPERQSHAVALYYLEDLAVADIAEILGCAQGTVKAHLHKGRLALARALGLLDETRDLEGGQG
jgi:RNA polymerase sigma-70 factor (ECF subfamily)